MYHAMGKFRNGHVFADLTDDLEKSKRQVLGLFTLFFSDATNNDGDEEGRDGDNPSVG